MLHAAPNRSGPDFALLIGCREDAVWATGEQAGEVGLRMDNGKPSAGFFSPVSSAKDSKAVRRASYNWAKDRPGRAKGRTGLQSGDRSAESVEEAPDR
jgi:hypothetical protein